MQSDFCKEEAIPLVIYNPESRMFEINEEAGDFLKTLSGPLGIISVAGMYRTGKSYLLNRMILNRSGGFGVGPTINPCTKGVWIWGKAIQGFTPEGEPVNVLVIDTEGLGALDEDSNHDVRIFSLAILISSYFIYNSVGSIDENALSNLSLVINLTKHIHLKSTGMSEDVDPEEYGSYFPSFMWVVRDFALQLVDQDGESMTSKEYLEKALQQQKGFSDGIEQKNRIRRLMKTFFKERDCCTMIRPLTKEENLQNLENIQLEELRPEFVEQVMQFRRKVINRIKPKLMHGKKLNGEMLFNLVLSYVEAINKGVVPNIETAWSYICKNECLKAQIEAYEKFDRNLQENFELRAPLFEEDLKLIYSEARKIALEDFGKVAVGDVQKQYLVELKDKMKHKYNQFKQENEKISEMQCLMFLQQNYVQIEHKLKNSEYSSIQELVEELHNFQTFFIDNGPQGQNRRLVLYDFINKCLTEASEFFFRTMNNEMFIQKQVVEEQISKLQRENKEYKDEAKSKIDSFEIKLRTNENEKAELSAKEQIVRENLSQITKEKSALEMEMFEKLEMSRKEHERKIEEISNKVHLAEENQKAQQRSQMSNISEFEKQKALLDQKVEFYEKQLEEAQRKEKELQVEIKNQKNLYLNSNKDSQKQYEQQIKEMNLKIDDLQERVYQQENQLQEKDQQFDQELRKLQDQDTIQQRELTKKSSTMSELQKAYDSLKKKYNEDVSSMKIINEEEDALRNERLLDLEQKNKILTEQLEMSKQKWEKDSAILKQKLEFQELQLKEERLKREEQRQSHEQVMRNIQGRERESVIGKEESSKRIAELNESHNKAYQELELKYEGISQRMSSQIDQLQARNQELEMSLKIQVTDFENEISTLQEQLQNSEEQRIRAQEQVKMLDSQKIKMVQDSESRHKMRELELEQEIEQKVQDYTERIQDIQSISEEQLAKLKIFYELEKEKNERKVQEEKDKAQKRMNIMVEEYEQKIRDLESLKDEDIQNLQDQLAYQDQQNIAIGQQMQHDIQYKQQQIETLQKYIQEAKESLGMSQQQAQFQIEQQSLKFEEERRDMMAKVERLNSEIMKKERQLTTQENLIDNHKNQLEMKERLVQELKKDLSMEKGDLQAKLETARQKQQEALDELIQKRSEYEREKALKTQQLQFQEQRIQDLTKQLEDTVRSYDERIKQEREDQHRDSQEKVARVLIEKQQIEVKFEEKRKVLKELEQKQKKENSQREKEQAVQQEKQQHLDQQQRELIKNLEEELAKKRDENQQLTMQLQGGEQAVHNELLRWKNDYHEIERKFQDMSNNYDKDVALWQGKFIFLEQQKETSKRDLDEAQKKFQQTIEQVQKAQQESKNKSEAQQSILMQQQENKYMQRMKEIQDNAQFMYNEQTSKVKQLERDARILTEKLEISTKSKMTEQGSLEKKLEKHIEEKERLLDEIEKVKADRDAKIQEYQRLLDKEKDAYKAKLRDMEGKGMRVESKQTEFILNFEKDRAKWEQERSFLISQKEDATETSQRLEKKVEQLTRDNEKLKGDLRANKRTMYQATANTNTYTSAMIGTKILGNLQSQGLGGMLGKDGSGTERSTLMKGGVGASYQGYPGSFTGGQGGAGLSHGAVGGLSAGIGEKGGLDQSLIAGMGLLSTPSSHRSEDMSGKGSILSPDEKKD